MRPEILSYLDRKEDALAQSWADFEKQPSEFGYEEFMRYVPKGDRTNWHGRAMGFRILNAKKSKYYENGLSNFEAARNLYRKAGLEHEWEGLVNTVRVDHARKYAFMPGFERIVSGASAHGPSFADRAKARWAKQMGSDEA